MKAFVLLFFVLFSVTFALGQAQPGSSITPEMRTAATEAYQKQDWKAAIAAYETIAKAEPQNAGGRYRLGMSRLALNLNAEAVTSFEEALAISPNPVFALAAAKAYARVGNKDKMFDIIERSLTMGGIAPDSLTGDADFASFKTDAKFADLVKRSDAVVNPCKARPEFRQFDFWIGEWLPKNTQGVTVGTSSIQLILGSCIIFENWTTPVSNGKSFNLFDTRDGKWHQTWVDDKGLMTNYVGGLVDGKMVLDSPGVVNGQKSINRMTFSRLENGYVRQHGQSSTDEGKTWTTTFDFTYVRKK